MPLKRRQEEKKFLDTINLQEACACCPPSIDMHLSAAFSLGACLGGVGAVRGLGLVLTGRACQASLAARQHSVLFGAANRRLLSGGRGGGGTGGAVGNDFHKNSLKLNMELNKRISSIESMKKLCDLIHASSTQFNHVNVATAFRKVLQMPRRGSLQDSVDESLRKQDSVEKALQTLENSAQVNINDFSSQQIAKTLHIMAEKKYKPSETLLLALEGQAEAISGEFNSQEVANTLWAYATMGRTPGERVMRLLEGRAEAISGEFSSQDVANTLWAYATMGRKPGGRMMGILEKRAQATAGKSFLTVDELISRSSIEKIRALASMN